MSKRLQFEIFWLKKNAIILKMQGKPNKKKFSKQMKKYFETNKKMFQSK